MIQTIQIINLRNKTMNIKLIINYDINNQFKEKYMKLAFFITVLLFTLSSLVSIAKYEKDNSYGRGSIKSYREYGFIRPNG